MNVVLTGFRGSGKTVVGRELAARLRLEFVDTDEEVERRAGKTIAEIFEDEGEARFRELEREEVLRCCGRDGWVIAAGGGAVESAQLAAAMKRAGVVILLTAPAEVLHERIECDGTSGSRRPALTEDGGLEEVRKLLARRRGAYLDTAHLEVNTDGLTPAEVAERIEAELKKRQAGEGFS